MEPRRAIRVLRQAFPEPPPMDTAVSHAILRRASGGLEPETLRLHRPGPVVAFGPKDRLEPGFAEAVAAAAERGFAAVHRLAGGRAAVFHEETIAFSWVRPDRDPRVGITSRFRETAGILEETLRSLGVDARVGEVPGEYCPGEFSINARGRTKLVGIGQRLLQGAVHVGGVLVVGGSERVRSVLGPVYAALGVSWDPETTGSLQDERPSISWEAAARAVEEAFGRRFDLVTGVASDAVLSLAGELAPGHAVEAVAGLP